MGADLTSGERHPLKTQLYPRQRFGTTVFSWGSSSGGRKLTGRLVELGWGGHPSTKDVGDR